MTSHLMLFIKLFMQNLACLQAGLISLNSKTGAYSCARVLEEPGPKAQDPEAVQQKARKALTQSGSRIATRAARAHISRRAAVASPTGCLWSAPR